MSATAPFQAVEALVTTVRNLASNDSYKAIANMFDEIPRLRSQIESKSKEADAFEGEITRLKKRHESRLQEDVELYRTQQNKLEAEKTELSGKISTLTATIKQKDKAIVELKDAKNNVCGHLDQARKSLDEEMKKLTAVNTEITKLQQTLKVREVEIDKQKESLRDEKIQVSTVMRQLEDVQNANATLREELQWTTARLNEIEGFATNLHKEDEQIWVNRLDELWKSARRLVESHFGKDLPERSLEDSISWKRLKDSQFLDRPIPLPQSNSPAAKRMRISALLAILARCIDQHIFEPTYILDEEDVIRGLLMRLAGTNSKMESFCRGLLLSIFPEEQARNAAKAVERVVREVGWYIQDLLPVSQYESFRSGLEQVVEQARDAWHIMQRARDKFEPNFELSRYEDIQYQALGFEEVDISAREQNLTSASEGDEELLVIFPRVYLIDDAEPDPITPGVVLMKSQTVQAAEEMERKNSSSPTAGKAAPRARPNRSRKSISSNGGK